MQQGLKLTNLKFFTGMENYDANNAVPADKFYNVQNARFDHKILASKKGYQLLGDTLVGGTSTRGLFEYEYFDGSTLTKKLIRFYNSTFYEFNETTQLWNTITTVWPNIQDLDISGVNFANALYVVGSTNKNGNGVGKIFTGYDFVFTVSGVTITPVANDVYSLGGTQYIVTSASIIAGSGTVTMKRQINVTDPSASGSLTKVNGTGDATLNYSVYSKSSTVTTTFVVIANSPEGTAIEAFTERLFVIGDPSFTGQIISSQPTTSGADHYKVENWNTTTGATVYSAAKNNRLVSMKNINNALYYWSSYSIFQHTTDDIAQGDNPREISRTGGAINQKSTCVVENDVWAIDPTTLEVRSLGTERNLGENPRTKSLSEAIKRTMALLEPQQTNTVMTYSKRFVKIHFRSLGSPTNNLTIGFDYNTGGWTLDRGQSVGYATVFKGMLVYGEDNTGQTFYDDTGYSANNSALVFTADTPFMDDNRPDTFKRARYIYFRGRQSYTQSITLKLYRDGDYTVYSTYTIPSPQSRGVTPVDVEEDGEWGDSEYGDSEFGGSESTNNVDIEMYDTEQLISVNQRSNLFAIGLEVTYNGGKAECNQLLLKLIPENENYKRSDL